MISPSHDHRYPLPLILILTNVNKCTSNDSFHSSQCAPIAQWVYLYLTSFIITICSYTVYTYSWCLYYSLQLLLCMHTTWKAYEYWRPENLRYIIQCHNKHIIYKVFAMQWLYNQYILYKPTDPIILRSIIHVMCTKWRQLIFAFSTMFSVSKYAQLACNAIVSNVDYG